MAGVTPFYGTWFKKERKIYYLKLFNFFYQGSGAGSGQKSSGSATLVLRDEYNIFFNFKPSFRTFFHEFGSGFFRVGSGFLADPDLDTEKKVWSGSGKKKQDLKHWVPGLAAGCNSLWDPMHGQVMNQPGHSSSSEQGLTTSVQNLSYFEMAPAPTGGEWIFFAKFYLNFNFVSHR